MENFWTLLIAASLFLTLIFFYWKVTRRYAEKEYGVKMFKQWGTRTFYWQGALFLSGGATVLIIFLLKQSDVLPF